MVKMNDEIYIIGGGTTLKEFNFGVLRNRNTIAINMAVFDVPEPDYMITKDYSFLKKAGNGRIESLRKRKNITKIFVLDRHFDYIIDDKRGVKDSRFNLYYNLSLFDMVIKSNIPDGIGFRWSDFRSGNNSGTSALQLAVLLNYKKIYLLGIDLKTGNGTHYHDIYPRYHKDFTEVLKEYAGEFFNVLNTIKNNTDISVYSCSSVSCLNEIIPYVPLSNIQE